MPSAAHAFFCAKSSGGNKYFGRTVPFPARAHPQAAYRLPPIMPRQRALHMRGFKRPPASRNPVWRPIR